MGKLRRDTIYAKGQGELAIRRLSKEAQEYYYGTSPLEVYEVEDENGEKRYDVTGADEAYGLTFEELDEMFRGQMEAIWEDMRMGE